MSRLPYWGDVCIWPFKSHTSARLLRPDGMPHVSGYRHAQLVNISKHTACQIVTSCSTAGDKRTGLSCSNCAGFEDDVGREN